MKHSKTPWIFGGVGENILNEEISSEIISADGFPVAECLKTCILPNWQEILGIAHWSRLPGKSFIERSDKEVEANIRLIAAAPELLEACKAMYDYIFTDKDMYKTDIKKLAESATNKAESEPKTL